MHLGSKGVLSLAFIAAAAISSANINYNNVVATVTFDGGTAQNLTWSTNGNSITFNPPPTMIVSDAPGQPTSAVIDISYDVTSSKGLNGVDLIFTGLTQGNGTINYDETITANNVTIASTSGTKSGDGGPFVQEDFLNFNDGSHTAYSVTKEFNLNLGDNQALLLQNPSVASIGLIEQNAVPEPATLGAVGVGLFGILARKRRK